MLGKLLFSQENGLVGRPKTGKFWCGLGKYFSLKIEDKGKSRTSRSCRATPRCLIDKVPLFVCLFYLGIKKPQRALRPTYRVAKILQ